MPSRGNRNSKNVAIRGRRRRRAVQSGTIVIPKMPQNVVRADVQVKRWVKDWGPKYVLAKRRATRYERLKRRFFVKGRKKWTAAANIHISELERYNNQKRNQTFERDRGSSGSGKG